MWLELLLASVQLLELHGPDGQRAFLNPHEISTLREPVAHDLRWFAPQVHCVVSTTNGKVLSVVEPCDYIRDRITGRPP